MSEKCEFEMGSGNVFEDVGLPDAEKLLEEAREKARLNSIFNKPERKTFAVTLYIDADDLDDETVDRIYEAGFDDATLARSGGKTKVRLDREGESWLDVALKAVKQLHDVGFVVIGMEWEKEMQCS